MTRAPSAEERAEKIKPYKVGWLKSIEDEIRAAEQAAREESGLRTPDEWSEITHIKIMDPDGWRSKGDPSWETPLTYADWNRRMMISTCMVDARVTHETMMSQVRAATRAALDEALDVMGRECDCVAAVIRLRDQGTV